MSTPRERVLIVEHDAGLGELLVRILDDEGYDAQWMLNPGQPGALLDSVQQIRPDLLILDLLPQRAEDCLRLLDALRADPEARRLPVLAMASAEPLAESAHASYNIRGAVTKPFELAEFLDTVREALARPPFSAHLPPDLSPPAGVLALAERILATRSREALFMWVQRLRQREPWRGRNDLRLSELLNSVPVLVEALDSALNYDNPARFFEQNPEAQERVVSHARVRRDQGFPLRSLIEEYGVLRDALWDLLMRYLPPDLPTDQVHSLIRMVDGTLDHITLLTIPTYLQAPGDQQAADSA